MRPDATTTACGRPGKRGPLLLLHLLPGHRLHDPCGKPARRRGDAVAAQYIAGQLPAPAGLAPPGFMAEPLQCEARGVAAKLAIEKGAQVLGIGAMRLHARYLLVRHQCFRSWESGTASSKGRSS